MLRRSLCSSTWSRGAPVAAALLSALTAGCSPANSSSPESTCTVDATIADAISAGDGNTLPGLPSSTQISLTTLYESPLGMEGLTGDSQSNLYVAGQGGGSPCPVWRIATPSGTKTVVGTIPAPCTPLGITFDASGNLLIADTATATIWKLTPNGQSPPMATAFATGVPGANGIAFDSAGRLWVTDGTTGQGRVWRVAPDGGVIEAFRVQPLANLVNLAPAQDMGDDAGEDSGEPTSPVDAAAGDAGLHAGDGGVELEASAGGAEPDAGSGGTGLEAGVGGVGRDSRALPPGALMVTPTTRAAANTAGSVPIVANGILFTPDGILVVADTARGALWKVALDDEGHVMSPVDCDTTFMPDTLCLQDLFVEHPILEGLDGIVLDTAGNIWGVANERNAVVVVTPSGSVQEVFRNLPDVMTQLRNGGPLEFPTSPFFLPERKFCITQSDVSRRDNYPNSGGEVGPQNGGAFVAKISCIDQPLPAPGLTLPVQ
ncbi:MAG TPA: SMP-30/gluconolactonase/LRE family protein [Polyangiaceae bacterium]|nr:SMP-30/gluconolactonase/LRE family protein [Polyangiaceae bacterium]